MITDILAFWTPGPLEILIILILVVAPIILISRFLVRSSREKRRMRLELGKLADELQQVKEQMKSDKKEEPPAESG